MNDLIRPALYNAKHKIIPTKKSEKKTNKIYEFVGPICESTDKFSTLKVFQKLNEKDFVVICDVGAYGMSLSSNYNLRPKPAELLIEKSKIKIISKRQIPNIYKIDHLNNPFALFKSSGECFNLKII